MGILAIGRRHPVLAGVQLLGEKAPGLVGIGPGPLLGAQYRIDNLHAGIEMLVQQVGIYRQRTRRAVVAADQRVRVGAGIDHHMQAELIGQVYGVGALEENRIDIAAQQADQLVVAPAEAAHPRLAGVPYTYWVWLSL